MSPKISVLIPVYNAAKYLEPALESILGQSFGDFECVIVNDGSTDGSEAIILSYNDGRIRYFKNTTNQGLIYTLNRGIQACQGEYIARMDADDIASLDRFEKQVALLDSHHEIGVCGTWYTLFDERGVKTRIELPVEHDHIVDSMYFHCPIGHPTVMVRRQLLDENKYHASFQASEDYELWTRLMDKTHFYNLPISLLDYRWHAANVSITASSLQRVNTRKAQFQIWKKKFPQVPDMELQLLLKAISPDEFSFSNQELRHTLEIVNKFFTAKQGKGVLFREMVMKHLIKNLQARISKWPNSRIAGLVTCSPFWSLAGPSLIKQIAISFVRNIIGKR